MHAVMKVEGTAIALYPKTPNTHALMHAVMKVEGTAIALYFVVLILFGNFLLLNLFLAILLDNFAAPSVDDDLEVSEGAGLAWGLGGRWMMTSR